MGMTLIGFAMQETESKTIELIEKNLKVKLEFECEDNWENYKFGMDNSWKLAIITNSKNTVVSLSNFFFITEDYKHRQFCNLLRGAKKSVGYFGTETSMYFEILFYENYKRISRDTYLFDEKYTQTGKNTLQLDENSDIIFNGFFKLMQDYVEHDDNQVAKIYKFKTDIQIDYEKTESEVKIRNEQKTQKEIERIEEYKREHPNENLFFLFTIVAIIITTIKSAKFLHNAWHILFNYNDNHFVVDSSLKIHLLIVTILGILGFLGIMNVNFRFLKIKPMSNLILLISGFFCIVVFQTVVLHSNIINVLIPKIEDLKHPLNLFNYFPIYFILIYSSRLISAHTKYKKLLNKIKNNE